MAGPRVHVAGGRVAVAGPRVHVAGCRIRGTESDIRETVLAASRSGQSGGQVASIPSEWTPGDALRQRPRVLRDVVDGPGTAMSLPLRCGLVLPPPIARTGIVMKSVTGWRVAGTVGRIVPAGPGPVRDSTGGRISGSGRTTPPHADGPTGLTVAARVAGDDACGGQPSDATTESLPSDATTTASGRIGRWRCPGPPRALGGAVEASDRGGRSSCVRSLRPVVVLTGPAGISRYRRRHPLS